MRGAARGRNPVKGFGGRRRKDKKNPANKKSGIKKKKEEGKGEKGVLLEGLAGWCCQTRSRPVSQR